MSFQKIMCTNCATEQATVGILVEQLHFDLGNAENAAWNEKLDG